MRGILQIIAIVAAFFVLGLAGCRHDDAIIITPAPATGGDTTAVNTSGTWTITRYNDRGTDMTDHFAGYVFSFGATGTMTVNTGAGIVNGTWRTATDDSKQKFIISLTNADPMLAELNEDWLIETNTATEIDLMKTGGHPRSVHFTKQ